MFKMNVCITCSKIISLLTCFLYYIQAMANIWCRAVWKEGDHEEEEVIPTKWITDNYVHWPKVSNSGAIKAIRENWTPEASWDQFQLVKIKITSG